MSRQAARLHPKDRVVSSRKTLPQLMQVTGAKRREHDLARGAVLQRWTWLACRLARQVAICLDCRRRPARTVGNLASCDQLPTNRRREGMRDTSRARDRTVRLLVIRRQQTLRQLAPLSTR